jgi:hypothetical protein
LHLAFDEIISARAFLKLRVKKEYEILSRNFD